MPVIGWAVALASSPVGDVRTKRGDGAVRVEATTGAWTLGDGEPVATIRTDDFELLRAYLGRRSPDQVASWVVDGDPAAVGTIALFGPRPDPLVE